MVKQTHGMSKTPLYYVWRGLLNRSHNHDGKHPTYAGVGVDPRWSTFVGFLANPPTTGRQYEPGLCLSRVGDLGDYSPENTRFISRVENSQEQRRPGPREVCVNGHAYTEENTYRHKNGYACCVCRNDANLRFRAKYPGGRAT